MRVMKSLRNKMEGLIEATNRYPLTLLFLIAIATVNLISINHDMEDYSSYLFAFVIGALLSAVGQQIYERFFTNNNERFITMGIAILLASFYYFSIRPASIFSMENGTKTAVMIFALSMVFIWVPTIKSKITFNESFMSTFKAFFTTALFTAVISGGVSLIIFATDSLLFDVNYKTIPHALNLVISIFAPLFFLSFTPFYPGKMDVTLTDEELSKRDESVKKAISCPKNLGILISYIIIPLTAVYTVILLAYVLLNIRGDFWTENLLEPMLVSYSIAVILVYLLASSLDNRFASIFRKIFPKVLIPIVLFQMIASIMKINEIGLTHGRYYVILFGIFALIAGLIFSFLPIKKNGLIAAVLIVFSAISIIPPIDAFTVSRVNHIHLLEKTLVKNDMLENNKVIPNASISVEDKRTITRTVSYLNRMNYTNEISWLPKNMFFYDNFKKIFGFEQVYDYSNGEGMQSQYAHLEWGRNSILQIEGYDFMTHLNINSQDGSNVQEIPLEKDSMKYKLTKIRDGEFFTISVKNEAGEELIQFSTEDIFNYVFGNETLTNKGNIMTVEQATITKENEQVKMSILINSADAYNKQYNADFYVFLGLKK